MTQTFTKELLSASANGKGVVVSGSASPGTLIHTAVSGSSAYDEIWLYAACSGSASSQLTIQFGGTDVPGNAIIMTVPALGGLLLVVPGLILQNSLELRGYADIPNVINVVGFVNRVT